MKKCKNPTKIVFFICIFFLVSFIIYLFLSLNYQREKIIEINKVSLQVTANEKAVSVKMFLESQKEKQETLVSMNAFKEAILYPDDASKIEIAKNRMDELRHIVPGISLMDSRGIVSIGDVDLSGTDYSSHPYFISKREDIVFTRYYDPLRKKDYYAIIGPIYDNVNKSKIIGRIAFDIELDKISLLMEEVGDSEKNSEVYLIDETGLLLSSSKYIGEDNNHGVLIQEIKSEGAEDCLKDLEKYQKNGVIEEHEEEVVRYKNYMGDEVYGAYVYIPEIGGCVIAEKSADEIDSFYLTKFLRYFLKGGKK